MNCQNRKRCYMHIGSILGIFLGIVSGMMYKSVPFGICIVLGLMFGGAIGSLVDDRKDIA